MRNINYNERNAFKSLGTFAFVILWIFIKIIFAGFLKILIINKKCKSKAKRLYKHVTNELFFNIFIESQTFVCMRLLKRTFVRFRSVN